MFRLPALKILFAVLTTCIILHIFLVRSVFANVDPITISSQTSQVTFPKSLDFQMSALDTNNLIIHTTLYIKYNSDGYSEQHDIDISKPQRAVQVRWHEDTSTANYSAVGTVITYYWHILDSAGDMHDEKPQSFSISDTRFRWQHLNTGFLQVNWYGRPKSFGQDVLGQANQELQHIRKNLGVGFKRPVNLWVYGEALDFHTALPPQAHEWVGGIAFPALNQASIVAYDVKDDTLVRDMPHELTHLVFHQISGTSTNVPLWFDEGLAVYNQLYHELEMSKRFKLALSLHTLIPLDDIDFEFPADANKAYLAYGESWKLTDYMYHTFGSTKMSHLIQDLQNKGVNWNDDLHKEIGIDQKQLENQWRISLHQSPIPNKNPTGVIQKTQKAHLLPGLVTSDPLAPLLLTAGLLMVILPLFGFGGLMLYWRNNRQREGAQQEMEQRRQYTFSSQQDRTSMKDRKLDFRKLPETPKESWSEEGWGQQMSGEEPHIPQE